MHIVVFDQEGVRHEIAGGSASSVMEMIRDHGLSIAAQCGGSAACATCHVYVDPEWFGRLPPMGEDEDAMIELAVDIKPVSRLSCQLKPDALLDGLVLTLAPGTEF
ncbi:2Fe-2S iron-sulfur cluster binding domain-containing protein [Chelativorans sp. ZYF759]|nr:2Fe-2S iron-sulfur cluster binding domain-containing protein [Chelativorans sp. ZYF759]